MEKFTMYLGLNDKDTKTQKIDTIEAYKTCEHILLHYTGGATIFEASGIYKHDDGTFTTEKTLRIELLFTTEDVVKAIAEQLKRTFNQESIAIQKQTIESYLL